MNSTSPSILNARPTRWTRASIVLIVVLTIALGLRVWGIWFGLPYIFHNDDGARFTYIQKRYTMKRLCRNAGVKVFGFHAIRHHVASILADSGKASLSQIQKMLRHRRTTTTDNYIKTLDPQLRQVANVLDQQGKRDGKLNTAINT